MLRARYWRGEEIGSRCLTAIGGPWWYPGSGFLRRILGHARLGTWRPSLVFLPSLILGRRLEGSLLKGPGSPTVLLLKIEHNERSASLIAMARATWFPNKAQDLKAGLLADRDLLCENVTPKWGSGYLAGTPLERRAFGAQGFGISGKLLAWHAVRALLKNNGAVVIAVSARGRSVLEK